MCCRCCCCCSPGCRCSTRTTEPSYTRLREEDSIDGARISRLCEDNKLLTHYFEGVNTVHDCFQRGVQLAGDKPFLGWKPTPDTPFKWMTYNEVNARAKAFGDGLIKLGLPAENDTRVGIYSQNRPEYVIADQGFLYHSMTPVPLYDTLGVEACNFIVNQADLHVIVCDNNAKVKSLLDRRREMPDVSMMILFEPVTEENKAKAEAEGIQILHLDEVEKLGRENPVESHPPKPDDLCMVCYTSGTTGTPKGAMITHRNMAVCVSAALKVLESCGVEITNEDVLISYLPLAHSYERALESCLVTVGAKIGFFQGDVRKLMDDIKELQPTLFPSVPRLLNRFYDKVMSGVNASKVKKFLFNMALNSKSKELKRGVIRNNSIWDKIVFRTVQAALGGRVRVITTGSAPISSTVLSFLRCIVGCPLLEGYGQTENTGIATVTVVGDSEPGHVGPPLPSLMVKLEDVPEMDYYSNNNKGEVCLKGGNVFVGYLKDQAKTDEALDKDGWLHTGDIGEWMPSGTLKIIDRKKNIFKLAQGEYIAPEKIENILAQSPYLAQVYVHGDSLQACLVSIVIPDPETLPGLASKLGVTGSMEELCKNEEVKKAIFKDLIDLSKKNGLSSLEQVKDIYVHPELFSVENGMLTPTFKLKRSDAHKNFTKEIADMYEKLNAAASAKS
ncbi:long-chain-fatty-acid--CoA ligase 1 isoform X2 [Aplysia californica]|uniref:Long-chain-fatty-acid--CoA ligase n=1 Tax=Aplysia californica TaxID=6500 RepID=A0ABM0JIY7_APLCA|nr:long-chain-fatty-acid--CoA ligase 1 isoform X2 [Aplysia californica]